MKKKRETKKKKRKKMLVHKLEMGYCPNCVVTNGLGNWALGVGAHGTALGAQAEARKGAGHGAQAGARGPQQGSGALGTGVGRAAWACC